ncbi:metallophosphoesterase family protein [Nanoarchaeota archaeon]
MRFAVIGDIHIGPEAYFKGVLRKLNKDVINYIHEFNRHMNENIKPSFVANLGDTIQDNNYEEDKINFQKGVDLFKELDCPVYHILGNHDLKKLSREETATMAGVKNWFYSAESEFHLVFLDSILPNHKDHLSRISAEQRQWLEKDLERTDKKTIIFVHHALDDQDTTSNPWFEGREPACLIENRTEVRKILEESKNVIAVIQGHLHWNRLNVHNNIPYFTVQSLVENAFDDGVPSKAYAIVDISDEEIIVDVKGHDAKRMQHSYSN